MKRIRRLTLKQQRFVAEYLIDLNATQAAIRAGYSPHTANRQGPRLLGNAGVAAAVALGADRKVTKLEATAERVLEELSRIALNDPRALFDDAGRLRPPKDWPDDVAAAVSGIEVTTRTLGQESDSTVTKVRRWDKTRALELLAKYYGLLKDRVEHTGKDGVPLRVVFGGRYKPEGGA